MRENCAMLTILTPTYNRAELLKQLYRSLCNQTCKDFQWLVIDDGSTDHTGSLINSFLAEGIINIDYQRKANGGKHTALNYAHPYIKGEYLVIVDSDDYLMEDAVETILTKWKEYSPNLEIAGITFQRGEKSGYKPFDSRLVGEYLSTFAEETNCGMHGDHCETIRTERFVGFMFPIFSNERFIAEGAMWYETTKRYKVVYCSQVIYLAEYLNDGLTKSGRRLHIQNPKGGMWHASVFLNRDFNLKIRIKNALLYVCYGMFAGRNYKEILSHAKSDRGLICLCWIPGQLLYYYWKRKYSI